MATWCQKFIDETPRKIIRIFTGRIPNYRFAGFKQKDEVGAATVILRELWNRLRETHKLRVVK